MEIINALFLSSLGVGACAMGDFAGVLLLRSDSFRLRALQIRGRLATGRSRNRNIN